ncbi:MAG TPA: peptidase M61 [Cytophagales bacterium]|jgi:predicted metalloprotease with PDZ domain|nr:peptidase M61 [Cytophagales bacterium]
MRTIFTIAICCITLASFSQKKNQYQYSVDLTQIKDDKLFVELKTPAVTKDEIVFYLPKIIPGTYAIADYGRYVSDFKAFDKKGKELTVEKINDNGWKIKEAKRLTKISYWIDDTFDTEKSGAEIFWPAGTNFEEGKDVLLNEAGFFGYLDGLKEVPFQMTITRPQDFYGSTGLVAQRTGEPLPKVNVEKPEDKNKRVDIYQVENYDRLVDSPMLYAKADTAIIKVGNAEVLIGSYSPNQKITAKQIAENVKEVLMAQKEYLGGKLPVDKYAFMFYWTDKPVNSYGALEHSYSSMYYMPEQTIEQTKQQLRDFAAHEFFHIVTPLTIHSEEIQFFDFNDPKMSKHLWLYEGVTEYFAGNVQVKYGLITKERYLAVLKQKMSIADNFVDDVPFTDISKFTLDKYHDQYFNVYQKGALIGMCLDIKLRKLSGGKYGMQNLIFDLSKKYGKAQAFKDEELFDVITKLTYPEIGEFLKTYVGGNKPLPFEEIFPLVGVKYEREKKIAEPSTGLDQKAITFIPIDGKPRIAIKDPSQLNEQGKSLNFKEGDVIDQINGEKLPDLGPALGAFFDKLRKSLAVGNTLSYVVLRKNESGEMKEVELKAPIINVEKKLKHLVEFDANATAEQLAVQKAWLTPSN